MDDRLVVAVRVLEGGVQVCHAACDVQRDPPGLHTTRARPNSALIARQQGARAVARYWAIMIMIIIILMIISASMQGGSPHTCACVGAQRSV
jgi:hypothetical protein